MKPILSTHGRNLESFSLFNSVWLSYFPVKYFSPSKEYSGKTHRADFYQIASHFLVICAWFPNEYKAAQSTKRHPLQDFEDNPFTMKEMHNFVQTWSVHLVQLQHVVRGMNLVESQNLGNGQWMTIEQIPGPPWRFCCIPSAQKTFCP